MATCEKREIVQPKPPVEYVLTLSADEARAVYDHLWAVVVGSADHFTMINRVVNALYNAGVRL